VGTGAPQRKVNKETPPTFQITEADLKLTYSIFLMTCKKLRAHLVFHEDMVTFTFKKSRN
jgi:hypothetical protein